MNIQLFSKKEVLIIIVAVMLLFFSFYITYENIQLRHYFFNLDMPSKQPVVGIVQTIQGTAKRIGIGNSVFTNIQNEQNVYNLDTIYTGSDSSATIKLDDNSEISLSPNSMIKLEFSNKIGITGVERTPLIEVISGEIKNVVSEKKIFFRSNNKVIEVNSKNPTPAIKAVKRKAFIPLIKAAPISEMKSAGVLKEKEIIQPIVTTPPIEVQKVPHEIEIIYPKNNSNITFSAQETITGKNLLVKIKSNLLDEKIRVLIKKTSAEPRILYDKEIIFQDYVANIPVKFVEPGQYQIQTLNETSQLSVDRIVPVKVIINPTLIADMPLKNNLLKDIPSNHFTTKISWKPINEASSYNIELTSEAWKSSLKKTTSSQSIELTKNEIESFPFTIKAKAVFPNNFIGAESQSIAEFKFLPPPLTSPKNKEDIKSKRILLTWEKTLFNENYIVEVFDGSTNPQSLLSKTNVIENFTILYDLKPGRYFWRVTSKYAQFTSSPSSLFEFQVVK